VTSQCLHRLFEEQVQRTPGAAALTVGGETLTYAVLNGRANRVAWDLIELEVAPDQLVGVPADRSTSCLVAILGVLKAGAAYLPFAADATDDRTDAILDRAGARVFAGGEPTARLLDRSFPFVRSTSAEVQENPSAPVDATDAAYVTYTSGSTGLPKGVVTEHRQIVSSTLARLEVFPLPSTTYLMTAPFTFNAAAAGTYFTLCTGGRLLVPTAEEVLDPELLGDLIRREGVTHLDAVPAQYAALVAFQPGSLAGLQCCVLAGERLPTALAEQHFAVAPDVPLFNEYGATETTVWSTVHRCRPGETGDTVPIGRPIRNVRVHVLDEELRPVPSGLTGEIHVEGAGVARGYLHEPELTAKAFLPNPFADGLGSRLYRTGDLGMVDDEGVLHYRGRVDDQVKVRGFRVEPAEVEAKLLEHPDVMAAAVVGVSTGTGTRLAGFTVSRTGTPVPPRSLSRFLRELLPEFMVPTVWRSLDELPLSPNGKVDRRRLQALGD
jgi:amino acid adenylation domain-containing protein